MSFEKLITSSWTFLLVVVFAQACQHPLRPIYNATQRQYVSCNAWEPDCATGTFCQLANKEWKSRLQINPDYTLFLCCAEEKDEIKESTIVGDKQTQTSTPIVHTEPTTAPSVPTVQEAAAPSSSSSSHTSTIQTVSTPPSTDLPSTSTPASSSTSTGSSTSSSTITTTTATWTAPTVASSAPSTETTKGTSTTGAEKAAAAIEDNTITDEQRDAAATFGNLKPSRPTSFPVFAPQPQILLPGNGLKAESGPRVVQIIVGELTDEAADGTFKWSGSSVLVQDSGLNILVDTGSAQNRHKLISALAQQGIKPQNIQIVIYTQSHPGHMGNDNVFPYAEKIYATFVFKGDEWISLQQLKEPSIRLTQNVEIWQTPGRSYLHNSVIVRNVANQGSVAISGNVFLNEKAFNHPTAWTRFAVDRELLTQVRSMLLCQSEYIIPAYGAPFVVPTSRKSAAGCNARRFAKVFRRLHKVL